MINSARAKPILHNYPKGLFVFSLFLSIIHLVTFFRKENMKAQNNTDPDINIFLSIWINISKKHRLIKNRTNPNLPSKLLIFARINESFVSGHIDNTLEIFHKL